MEFNSSLSTAINDDIPGDDVDMKASAKSFMMYKIGKLQEKFQFLMLHIYLS